ncbi:nuclear transport factor 2 family protein [Vibrio diabolicus]|uniref:nuclear transport factor 2 family protein n=1 Tax=Vibrio diabolicus TaxID=50719 RepID=UPI003753C172
MSKLISENKTVSSFTNNSTECSEVKVVKSIDESWENALNHGVRSVVEELLHPDFVWVHNQAEMIQRSKLDFLNFFDTVFPHSVSKPVSVRSGIREQRNVKVIKHPGTAVVYGFTDVKRAGGSINEPDTRPLLVFHFMRTYVKAANGYLLLANHTMLLSEGK